MLVRGYWARSGGGVSSWWSLYGLFALLLVFSGCGSEPLRDNPADPGSSSYDPDGNILLTVRNLDGDALSGACIEVPDQFISVYSNDNGRASINLPPGQHALTLTLEGYVAEEVAVSVPFRGNVTRFYALNGKPIIDSLYFTSLMQQDENPDLPRFIYYYNAHARVIDADGSGDVELVGLHEGDTQYPLTPTEGSGNWYHLERELGYNVDDLSALVHQPIRFVARDEQQDSSETIGSIESFFYYKQLWEDLVLPGPNGPGSASAPVFEWLNPRYLADRNQIWFDQAKYRVEVFRANESESTIDTTMSFVTTDTEVDTFRLVYPGTLTAGIDYRWRLTLYDPFGNAVRTRKSSFILQ